MTAFSTTVLERGAVERDDLENSVANQAIFGGDLATNLVEVGALKENALQRLLCDYYEMPPGPRGQLAPISAELETVFPAALARLYRIYPVEHTQRTLHLAVAEPLEPETERALRAAVGLQLRCLVVTPLRLHEALWRYCSLTIRNREQWLLGVLNAVDAPEREQLKESALRRAERLFPKSASYRRMSERPEGILPSGRQAGRLSHTEPPDTLDGVGPRDPSSDSGGSSVRAALGSELPPSMAPLSEGAPESVAVAAADAAAEPGAGNGRNTWPYAENKRDTQPWGEDGAEEPDGPMSAPEFERTLVGNDEVPGVAPARFRHRGPLTRAQGELAVSKALESTVVLDVFFRYARQFVERSALLVVSVGALRIHDVHSMAGLEPDLELALDGESILQEGFASADPVVRPLRDGGVDGVLRRQLAIASDIKAAVIPLSVRERVVALFYGDDVSDDVDLGSVADITDFAEICAEELARLTATQPSLSPAAPPTEEP